MKKFLKGLSVVCLALILLCPLALVGCDRNYTINIQVVEGKGYVYLKDVEGHSVVGNNVVESNTKFEYRITPIKGYKISKILKDGEEVANFDVYGFYDYFDDVNKNHNVKVYFEKDTYAVNFYCIAAGNVYQLFKTINVKYEGNINLNNYGGERPLWYVKHGSDVTYIYNGLSDSSQPIPEGYQDSNILYVFGNQDIYCDLTEQELLDLGVAR